MERRVAVRGIVLQDDKIFCVRLKNYKNRPASAFRDFWCLPGGGVNPGEALPAALKREFAEELGVQAVVGALLYLQQFADGGREQLEFFFHVTNSDDFMNIDLSQTSHGLEEIAEAGFIVPSDNDTRPRFLQTEDVAAQAKSGAAKFFSYL